MYIYGHSYEADMIVRLKVSRVRSRMGRMIQKI